MRRGSEESSQSASGRADQPLPVSISDAFNSLPDHVRPGNRRQISASLTVVNVDYWTVAAAAAPRPRPSQHLCRYT